MSFWDRVKSAFSGGGSSSPSTKKKSSGRGSGGGSRTASLATDLKMGMATLGQSYGKAAETLASKGYSRTAIDSYISRTQETQKKAQASMMARNKDRDNTPAPASKPDIPYEQTTAPGFTGEPPATPTPPAESDQAKGSAEAAVADTAKKGRRSTIETAPQGLLAPAKTRKKRSLMGGLIA